MLIILRIKQLCVFKEEMPNLPVNPPASTWLCSQPLGREVGLAKACFLVKCRLQLPRREVQKHNVSSLVMDMKYVKKEETEKIKMSC